MHRVSKGAGEAITYRFDFVRALEGLWLPGEEYSASQFVRPPTPNGFEYQCTTGGQTAQDEPAWPTTLAGTVTDGSVIWTAAAFGTNATDTIASIAVDPDTGITVDSSSNTDIDAHVKLSGGTLGSVYDVLCKATTAAGELYTELLRVTIIE